MQNVRGSILLSCLLSGSFLSTEAQPMFTFEKIYGKPEPVAQELLEASVGLVEFLKKSYRPTIKLGVPILASRCEKESLTLKDAGTAVGAYFIYQLLKKEVEQSTGSRLALPTFNENCFAKDSYTRAFFNYVNKGIVVTNEGVDLLGPLFVQIMLQKVAGGNNTRGGASATRCK